MSTLSFELYWSFRSPYSYLAVHRMVAIQRDYDVAIRVRPVYPLAVRDPSFFKRANPVFLPYLFRDVARLAEMQGVPIGLPDPDPVAFEAPGVAAAEQPHIHRLTRLGIAAVERGLGLPFIDEVSRLIWDGTVKGWHEGDHLARAAERAGLDLAEMEADVAADPDRFEAAITANQQALEAAGHWGVPTMVFKGEPFFGQDRIDVLLWRMGQHELARRAP